MPISPLHLLTRLPLRRLAAPAAGLMTGCLLWYVLPPRPLVALNLGHDPIQGIHLAADGRTLWLARYADNAARYPPRVRVTAHDLFSGEMHADTTLDTADVPATANWFAYSFS